jgi:two-component system OmpR family response regulator
MFESYEEAALQPRLLLIEDEASLAVPTKRGLEEDGYQVKWVANGPDGLEAALTEDYDLLVVDWRLPGLDGHTLIKRLRQERHNVPILMLTALRDVDHRVAGLDAGADDYLTKPFSFEEFLARLRALRRRQSEVPEEAAFPQTPLRAGALVLNTARRAAHLDGQALDLRQKEYMLLELLLRRADAVVTRTRIAESVWGSAFDVSDNAIDITISTLRQKLREAGGETLVETVRGVGYRLKS